MTVGYRNPWGKTKLTVEEVLQIWSLCAQADVNVRQIAKAYKVCKELIYGIRRRRYWKEVTAHLPDIPVRRRQFHKLTEPEVLSIWAEYAAGGVVMKTLAQKYNVTGTTIQLIISRKKYNALTAHLPDPPLKPRLPTREETRKKVKLTAEMVKDIRARIAQGTSGRDLSREIGVSSQLISLIKTRQVWRHV